MRVAVAGAGGMGREVLAWLRDARPDVLPVGFFTVEATERPAGLDVDLPVVTTIAQLRTLGTEGLVLGIGDGRRRQHVADEAKRAGLQLLKVVHPTAFLGPGITVSAGAIVAPGCLLTRDVQIGSGAVVNYGCKVGHDCIVDDYAFIGPGAVLSGGVNVGSGAFVGAGSVLLPGVRVGKHALVGAGAVVISNVPAGATVVGVPARILGREDFTG